MRLGACVFAVTVALTGTFVGAQLFSPAATQAVARSGEVTAAQNLLRNDWDPNEPGLSPATVTGGSFGQLFHTKVTGQVYAQPLVVDDTASKSSVIAATEDNWVYSLDGETGKINWSRSLGPLWPSKVTGCTDLTPDIGVTSTPVYDPASGTLYVTAVVNDGPTQYQPDVYLYAINETTGAVKWKVPVEGAPVNDPTRPFNPLTERQRAGLLLLNGSIYLAFASYCDYAPYVGYVVGVNTATKALTMWSDEAGLTDTQGGIWMGGGGLMSDGQGPDGNYRMFLVTGNGVSPAVGPGTTPPPELGDSVVQLEVQKSGTLVAKDFFSPANAPALDFADTDFGSGGAVGLPFGTSTYPDLMLAAGKEGKVFLLNRDALGGRETGPGGTDAALNISGPYGGIWGHPAAFAGDGGADYVYYVGNADNMRWLKFDGSTPSAPTLSYVANSAGRFGFTSGSPVVTSNGTDPSSAVVWEVYSPGENAIGGGMLQAFDAVPPAGPTPQIMTPIWSAPIGTGVKFATPATANGRVYVGTKDGVVFGFGSPDSAPVKSPATSFGRIAVGKSVKATVTITAASTVTLTGASVVPASGPFTPQEPGWPVTLTAGQKLSIPVTFKPAGPGGFAGSLAVTTTTPNFTTVTFPLAGTGTQTGLYASKNALTFATTPVGASKIQQTDIINGGTSTETVSAVTGATAPFGITGLSKNKSIPPGGSVTINVTYKPTAATTSTVKLTVTGTGPGTKATVTLTAKAVPGQGTLTASTSVARLGNVHIGQFASQIVTLKNTGNLPVTVTGFTAPAVPFGTPTAIPTGLTIVPGYTLRLPITFTPQSRGSVGGKYLITYKDGRSPARTAKISVLGTGTPPAAGVAIPSPGGGWTLNGSAKVIGTALQLTQATQFQAGSAVYYQPMPSNGLTAKFTARLSGGNGADGMTFAMLNPAAASVSSVGGQGGMLGYGGLSGVAVVLGTHKDPGAPSGNFIGIATGSSHGQLVFAATTTTVPNLRSAARNIAVAVSGGKIAVSVNGHVYLTATVKLPALVLPAFTAGTGLQDDVHAVTAVSVSSGAITAPPPGGGWSYNGSAVMSGSSTLLTQTVKAQSGSVVYPRAVASNGLHARFNIQLIGGTGGEGLTFALLNPAAAATSRGRSGTGLGLQGLTGTAVTFGTFQVKGNPLTNFAAIATASGGTISYLQTAVEIGQLRTGTHDVSLTVQGGVLIVDLDGQEVLEKAVTLPPTVVLAYTASTGVLTDWHVVRNAAISATGF
jgi:hypothetical protein